MGCCIFGALIISRWLYAYGGLRRAFTRLRDRSVMGAALVLVELAILAGVVAHETGVTHADVHAHEAAAPDEICTSENGRS
jgi:hypothetical protein